MDGSTVVSAVGILIGLSGSVVASFVSVVRRLDNLNGKIDLSNARHELTNEKLDGLDSQIDLKLERQANIIYQRINGTYVRRERFEDHLKHDHKSEE